MWLVLWLKLRGRLLTLDERWWCLEFVQVTDGCACGVLVYWLVSKEVLGEKRHNSGRMHIAFAVVMIHSATSATSFSGVESGILACWKFS